MLLLFVKLVMWKKGLVWICYFVFLFLFNCEWFKIFNCDSVKYSLVIYVILLLCMLVCRYIVL